MSIPDTPLPPRESPILAHPSPAPTPSLPARVGRWLAPWQWAALAVLSFTGVAAFGLAPDTTLETIPTRTVLRALPVPAFDIENDTAGLYWREERVQRGDTIGALLSRAGMDDAEAMQFLRTDTTARPLYQLRPGRPVQVATGVNGELIALKLRTQAGAQLAIERRDGQFAATQTVAREEIRTTLRAGEIRSSLFAAADIAGIPDAITLALADVFAGDIDFYHDLRRGDRFTVLYETRFVDGEAIGPGRILAAEFVNRGNTLRAFLWQDTDGTDTWYSADGRSTRGTFLRAPMEFSRITSGFSLARFHPILQKWRAHKGVDYAAPTGTPIRATADGVVAFAGMQGGYGNVVFLRHHGAYSTVYGHMSRFAPHMRQGARVRQGETIGYVGMTGWATGPHLHYEFRVADEPRNPLNVALPAAQPITSERLAAFKDATRPAQDALALARSLPATALASTE